MRLRCFTREQARSENRSSEVQQAAQHAERHNLGWPMIRRGLSRDYNVRLRTYVPIVHEISPDGEEENADANGNRKK